MAVFKRIALLVGVLAAGIAVGVVVAPAQAQTQPTPLVRLLGELVCLLDEEFACIDSGTVGHIQTGETSATALDTLLNALPWANLAGVDNLDSAGSSDLAEGDDFVFADRDDGNGIKRISAGQLQAFFTAAGAPAGGGGPSIPTPAVGDAGEFLAVNIAGSYALRTLPPGAMGVSFTTANRDKLAGIAANANNYRLPGNIAALADDITGEGYQILTGAVATTHTASQSDVATADGYSYADFYATGTRLTSQFWYFRLPVDTALDGIEARVGESDNQNIEGRTPAADWTALGNQGGFDYYALQLDDKPAGDAVIVVQLDKPTLANVEVPYNLLTGVPETGPTELFAPATWNVGSTFRNTGVELGDWDLYGVSCGGLMNGLVMVDGAMLRERGAVAATRTVSNVAITHANGLSLCAAGNPLTTYFTIGRSGDGYFMTGGAAYSSRTRTGVRIYGINLN